MTATLPSRSRGARVITLYGPNNRPLAAATQTTPTPAYNSTGGGRATAGWNPGSDAINLLVAGGGDPLRRQARDLDRRNAWAHNAIETFVSNAIGTGIVPRWKDAEARAKLEPAWQEWVDQADASGLCDFYGLQSLAARTTLVAGECLARLRWRRPTDGLRVPLQIQLLEPEHLPLNKSEDLSEGRKVRWGIEFNPIGRRIAYHLYREHPGEPALFYPQLDITRVPAEEVVHLFKPLRPGQHRGQTWLAPVILQLWETEQYDRAELVRKGLCAMMAFFERDLDGNATQILAEGGQTDADGTTPIQGIEPGSYIKMPYGKTIESPQFKDMDGMYAVFLSWQLRKSAAGLGITYEQFTGDYSQVNYSSARQAQLEFRRRCETFQHLVMSYQFCRPLLKAFVDAAALAGVIDPRDYARRSRAYLDVEWSPPKWPWVDPEKDLKAEILAMENLVKSRSQVIKETAGVDRDSLDAEIEADQESERMHGLIRHGSKVAQTSPAGGGTQ